MERLTKEGKFCDVIECELTPGGSFCERGTCTERRLWERLSSIEDILGDDYDLDRLRELVEADRDGRCVVLPISTPSMAYTLNPKSGDISSGFYRTPGAVLHDTERGYIVVKNRKAAEEALKERGN